MTSKKKPTISVVIPTYGRSQMVRQAVLAALTQDFEPTEVIVSDDRSPDNSLEILNELADKFKNLKIIENTINSGGVGNWNKVIDSATSDYIAYCSDDDYFLPHHLRTSVEFLEQHPDISLAHSGFFNLTESIDGQFPSIAAELIKKKVVVIQGGSALKHIINQTSYPFQPSTFVFRRSLWGAIGPFDPAYSVADTDWFIRVGLSHRIAYIPVATVVNRRHVNNWSNRVGSVGMNLEFHTMMQMALSKIKQKESKSNFTVLEIHWLISELVKFSRIYVARSRAGLFEISSDCANAIWEILFKDRRGPLYRLYVASTSVTSRLLRLMQHILPGGVRKYQALGQDCPK